MGGKIAINLAALHHHKVSSIIVMSAPPKDVRKRINYLNRTKPGLKKLKEVVNFPPKQKWNDVVDLLYQTYKGTDTLFAVQLEANLSNVGGKAIWKSNMKTIAENAERLFGYEDLGQYDKEQ